MFTYSQASVYVYLYVCVYDCDCVCVCMHVWMSSAGQVTDGKEADIPDVMSPRGLLFWGDDN